MKGDAIEEGSDLLGAVGVGVVVIGSLLWVGSLVWLAVYWGTRIVLFLGGQ